MNNKELCREIKSGAFSMQVADCERNIRIQFEQLQQENKELKEVIDKLSSQIKLYGKYNGEKCTRGFYMMTADFNKLLDILKEVNK